MKVVLVFILFANILLADTLDTLLQKYKNTSDNSLQTVDEKQGHVLIYSQKELRLMQYSKLSDIIKELPLMNLNKNRYGLSNLSLPGTKTTTSGFFRFFINDHEISSAYDQSPSLSWGDLPLDFVDHVEIYYGESAFAQTSETGIYFIKIYTKSAIKENGGELKSTLSSSGSNTQSLMHSQIFENGWSYLMFLNNEKSKDSTQYNGHTLYNNGNQRYFYLDAKNENSNINIGYTDVKKDNYMGLSLDVVPDSGEISSKDFFIDAAHYLSDDKSIKASFAININNQTYDEKNAQGMALIPVLNLASMGTTIPKELSEDLKFIKTNASLSKSLVHNDNTLISALNVINKKYEVNNRKTTNFLNQVTDVGQYNNFDEETIYSVLFQDHYKVNDNLSLIANAKVDKYQRSGFVEDLTETLFRVGAIYTPFENFGLKSFYTQTYLPPSFFNVDFADKSKPNIKVQKYKFYTVEGVYTADEAKFGVTYHNVKMEDFIYLTPIGFTNIDHIIKTDGLIFDYEYRFSQKDKIHLNYYTTSLSESINNSSKGGYIKFIGGYDKLEYFTSLLYRNAYQYLDIHVRDSFDVGLGATYYFTKEFSGSIKGVNLFNKSTKSLYAKGFPETVFALEDSDRSIYLTLKWIF